MINEYNNSSVLVFNFFIFLFAAIIIIVLAYFATRLISLKFNGHSYKRNIKIIERFSFGIDKSLVLIELGDYHYFLYVSKNKIELIDKIEDLNTEKIDATTKSFDNILSKLGKK